MAEWFAAPGLEAQQRIAVRLQERAFRGVPFVPVGQFLQAAASRSNLEGVLRDFTVFGNLRKT